MDALLCGSWYYRKFAYVCGLLEDFQFYVSVLGNDWVIR